MQFFATWSKYFKMDLQECLIHLKVQFNFQQNGKGMIPKITYDAVYESDLKPRNSIVQEINAALMEILPSVQ